MGRGARGAVTPPAAFWDASALVPLFVQQPKTPAARSFYGQYEIVTWWGTRVEIASAIARLRRMNVIGPEDSESSLKIASLLSQSWSVIEPSSALLAKAEQLVQRYDLRAGDAFQLAAALEWCGDTPQDKTFLTAHRRLFEAAVSSGFDAQPF